MTSTIIIILFHAVPQLSFDDVSYEVSESVRDSHLTLYVCVNLLENVQADFTVQLGSHDFTARGTYVCIFYN